MKLKKNASFGNILSIKVKDAVCDLYFPESLDDVVRFTYEFEDYHILSGGSNIIAGKVTKPVLYMGNMIGTSDTEELSEYAVKTFMPAGVSVSQLINYSIKNGLSGVEFMAGIPGTLGGAVMGNAAPADYSWDDVAVSLYFVQNGAVSSLVPQFSYRHLDNAPDKSFVVFGVDLVLIKDSVENVRKRVMYHLSKRIKIKEPSSGSLFKNPENEKAGMLLDKAGMKGFFINDAGLSKAHANIVVNRGNAQFNDFCLLKESATEKVKEKFNVTLTPEVKFWYE
ncbi:MAG: UDP-N-acetylmuramate dehydrogenase [bacterium]